MMRAPTRVVWACLWTFAACREEQTADAGGPLADGGAEADNAAYEGCPTTIPPFALGMSAASPDGALKAVLRAASHVPPERYLNDWTVEFVDGQGNPRADVTLRQARAYMPVHGHYGTPDPRLTQHSDAPAVFDVNALNLFMRGPWEVQLAVSSPQSGEALLIFPVCVQE